MIARTSYLALLGLALFTAGCDSSEPATSVTYRVTAFGDFPATSATRVEWNDDDGQRQTQTNVALPWSRTVEIESGGTAYVKAVSESTTGAIGLRVSIEADGEVLVDDEGDGAAGLPGTQGLELSVSTTVD